jgi:hypothetical protein
MTKFNLKGWSFKTWAKRNKDSLKLIISGSAGILSAYLAGLTPVYSAGLGAIVAAVTKIILDTLDYWLSE